ncbi:MAG: hypothetical protein LQ351_005536 [Letrouitia transgressa]|nr:MAG: hypothetical protein LQ351_005536 [Letrouitia transgressa]
MLGHKGKLSKGATDREIEDGPGPEKYDSDLNELDAVDSIGDEKYGQTTRGLKSRHIQLIAIGGCIGTGLFVGTGATLSTVGPAPLFMLPVAVWITIVLLVIVGLNIFVVSWYGESEFWFASIKIIAILGLIILGVVLFFGGGPTHDRLGFRYWQRPGAFIPYAAPGDTGKFLAFWTSLVRSGFAFVLSPELIVIAAGETEAPRRNIPKASSRFIYRLIVFYVLGSLVISVIVSSDDSLLLQAVNSGQKDAGASPFVVGIKRAGIKALDHIINAVILTSAWSAGNSFCYAGSRSLYSLALTGQAPKIFRTCNKQGVPYLAVAVTALLACLVYLSVSSGSATVFTWFVNITTISGYVAWIVVLITYLRFRSGLEYNGIYGQRPYKSPGQPYTTYAALSFFIVLTLTNGFQVFFPGKFTASSFLAAYITLPIFIVLYVSHKIWFRTPIFYPASRIDVWAGKDEADRLEEMDVPPVARNVWEKIWFWIA